MIYLQLNNPCYTLHHLHSSSPLSIIHGSAENKKQAGALPSLLLRIKCKKIFGGLAILAFAVDPWLCVPGFRRVCLIGSIVCKIIYHIWGEKQPENVGLLDGGGVNVAKKEPGFGPVLGIPVFRCTSIAGKMDQHLLNPYSCLRDKIEESLVPLMNSAHD